MAAERKRAARAPSLREGLAADLCALEAERAGLLHECESGDAPASAADQVVALSRLIGERRRVLIATPELTWGSVRVHYTEWYYSREDDVGLSFSLRTREWRTRGEPHPVSARPVRTPKRQWWTRLVSGVVPPPEGAEPPPPLEGAELPPPPEGAAVVAVDGRVLAFGGRCGPGREHNVSSDILELSAEGAWLASDARLPMRFMELSAVAVGGHVYTFGGTADNEDGEFGYHSVGECLRFDPRAGTWTPRTPMPHETARTFPHTAVGVGDAIFVLGSHCRGRPFGADDWAGEAWLYYPGADRWEPLPPPPVSVPGVALEWAPDE